MKSNDKQVRFIRIRGRVVPIRASKGGNSSKTPKAVGQVAAGTAIGAASGAVAARLTVESAKLENSARRAAKFAQKAKISRHIGVGATDRYWRAAHVAINRSVRSLKVFSIAKKIKLVGAGAAAALIGTGLSNALRPKDNKKREALRAGAIGAGVFALQLAFLRGVGNKASPAILGALNKATRARMKKK